MITQLEKANLQHGDVLHCTGRRWLSKAIQFFTGSRISHTAIVIDVTGVGDFMIADAQANGVNLKSVDNWMLEYNYLYFIHRKKNPTSD
jgi:hypothetical protein